MRLDQGRYDRGSGHSCARRLRTSMHPALVLTAPLGSTHTAAPARVAADAQLCEMRPFGTRTS